MDLLPNVLLSVTPQIRPADLNVITEALFLTMLCFLLTLAIGHPVINQLQRLGIGKKILEEGPSTHFIKAGTPTMGGIMVVLSVFIVNAVFNLYDRLSMLLPLGVVISSGTLGAIDDLLNLAGGKRRGLAARFKMLWLLLFSVVAALALHLPRPFGLGLTSAYVPFVGQFNIGWWYVPIAIFGIVGTSNAVNLTDGLDTLAGGLLAFAFAAFGIIAYLQGQIFVTPLCFTTVGALLAFLWYNAHPAQVFMGDTGSLSLGALLAVVAFMTGQWLLLPVVGIVFVAVALSVILQVAYFKLTKGRRLFRMAPLHLHFEVGGWAETQVAMRFWVIGIVAAVVGVALALS
ncbi:MAG: phospho-N-acetylmuramoyl-pentapeptide-transferase [Chloroflexota bacterium]|nr:phospho-N-acetylmuramoyl-pentapeptide-transferase [Chloroflexota bacterium]